jgi:hypothetical protein
MQDFKNRETLVVKNKISDLEKSVSRLEQTNANIGNGEIRFNPEYISNFRAKNRLQIETNLEEIQILKERVKMIQNGELDDIFKDGFKRKEMDDEPKKLAAQVDVRHLYKKDNDTDRERSELRYQMKKAEYHYHNAADTLPEFMAKNLSRMPHNRGYIWRGVWFFGDLPHESDMLTMMEKIEGKMYVHEIYKGHVRTYEKEQVKRVHNTRMDNSRVDNVRIEKDNAPKSKARDRDKDRPVKKPRRSGVGEKPHKRLLPAKTK